MSLLVLRSAAFAAGQAVSTVLFAVAGTFALAIPLQQRCALMRQWTRFNFWWLKVTCGIDFVVEGRENIPSEPGIVMCKHQSAWETLALQLIFPAQTWILKRELLWVPFFGWGLATLCPIAIDRSAGTQALRKLAAAGRRTLDRGLWIVVFPEGHRMPPGERGKYQVGGASLAVSTGAHIVPVAHNSGLVWPRNSFIKRPGTVHVVVGPLMEVRGKTARQLIGEVENWIETTMQRLPSPPAA
jgi:1-acyl-sn-glycerol-3-phosphate acyltransferase